MADTGVFPAGTTSTTETTRRQNISDPSLAILEGLIQQLAGGGTPEQRLSTQQRLQETQALQTERAGLTKQQALADAQGLINQKLRQTLEQLLPTITRAAEGAGTSAGSMRALLAQDAAQKAAESAAAAGISAVGTYGTQFANLSQLLEGLTRPQDASTQALLQALQVARGATEETTATRIGTGTAGGGGGGGISGGVSAPFSGITPTSSGPGISHIFSSPLRPDYTQDILKFSAGPTLSDADAVALIARATQTGGQDLDRELAQRGLSDFGSRFTF